jgi:hypothetical protein
MIDSWLEWPTINVPLTVQLVKPSFEYALATKGGVAGTNGRSLV